MCKKSQLVLIMLSVIALLNVIFVPIFDVWGGIFPSEVDDDFFEIVDKVFNDSSAFRHWSVNITVSIFISCVLMLISSIIGNKSFSILTAFSGIAGSLYTVLGYGEEKGFEKVIDFDDGNISIGSWIAIILFILSFFIALNSKKKEDNYISSLSNDNVAIQTSSSEEE